MQLSCISTGRVDPERERERERGTRSEIFYLSVLELFYQVVQSHSGTLRPLSGYRTLTVPLLLKEKAQERAHMEC